MNYKNKFIYLGLLLSLLSNISFATTKYDSELIVSGSDIWERIEGNLIPNGNKDKIDHGIGKDTGKTAIKAALWAENKATVHNIGTIMNGGNKYETQYGGVLVFSGINNPLKKIDNLVVLKSGSKLINDGRVEMGGTDHKIKEILTVADLILYKNFAEYTKNVINMDNSILENNGEIVAKGDHLAIDKYVSVGLLDYNTVYYDKNVINSNGGKIINTGKISYDRDYSLEDLSIIDVGVLELGLHYNRNVMGINATGTIIENYGDIFVGGDLLQKKDFSGIDAGVIGVDIVGEHNKYGIKSNGGQIFNSGKIEVERDFAYGIDGNTILRLELLYGSVLDLGLLTFNAFSEKSVGVSFTNGAIFENDTGTIKVGVNNKKNGITIGDNIAIGIEADNSIVNFNGGKIELEGVNVWAASLTNSSNMVFNGESEIVFQTKSDSKTKVNTDIFGNDGTGSYTINGKLDVYGKTIGIEDNDGDGIDEGVASEDFITNLTLGKNSNIYIGVEELEKIVENGDKILEVAEDLGKLSVNGKLDIQGEIKFDGANLIGISDFTKYKGDIIISTGEGITGNTNIQSSTPIFSFSTSSDGKQIVVDEIVRNSFNDTVENKDLGKVFEDNYDTATSGQLDVYRYLAGGDGKVGFENRITEVTGRDTLTTLNSQIYDITKDLNKQFKDFAKSNTDDGVVFKYINSESELGSNSSTVGFERKSSGIMVGYNNYIFEKLRLGAGFSYMKSDIDYTSASSNDVTTWNFRGYLDYDLGFANIFSDLSFGYNQSENKRLSEGVDSTGLKEGDLDVYSLSFNNSLYKNYQINNKLSLTTSLNLDFTYLYQEDYEETGIFSASSESTDAFYVTAGLGVDGKYNLISFGNSKINLVAGIEYAYDIVSNTEKAKIKMKDFDVYHEEIRELDKKSLTYDIGLNYEYRDRYSVGAKYTKELINDIDNDQVGIDFTYKF